MSLTELWAWHRSAKLVYYNVKIWGQPSSCSFSDCLAEKELCERNGTRFTCKHISEVERLGSTEPEESLQAGDCRWLQIEADEKPV